MFIAHLPAGYLCAKLSQRRCRDVNKKLVFWSILIGSILPDIDMFYFYLIDNRQTHHHLYWTHFPSFWAAIWLVVSAFALATKNKRLFLANTALAAGLLLHLLLDSLVGGVAWLHPFSSKLYYMLEIPATRSWWVWNFVLHWTFLAEVLICLAALVLLVRSRMKSTSVHSHD
ncbi:metal-dependent hydrolase [Oceaniferula spumae]|uniref:Metal-dependent hydrolase n=1 Tax=Oceaniferula spumae TaxID=2979115 RepID=A0AAT9FP08_9BACT